jgi:hypothetical protein
MAFVMPVTATGTLEAVLVPLPRSPLALCPQHTTVLSALMAQECCQPEATWVMPVRPGTAVGVSALVVVPLPIWPESFLPQQVTVPSVRRAHV